MNFKEWLQLQEVKKPELIKPKDKRDRLDKLAKAKRIGGPEWAPQSRVYT